MTTIKKVAQRNEARVHGGSTCGRLHQHKDAGDKTDEALGNNDNSP